MKKILSLILIFALSISLVACTNEDASLYDAFKNMQDVRTIETSTDMSFSLEGEGLGEMETIQLNQVAAILNGMKLNVKGISLTNEDKTAAKAESEINIDIMGMSIPIKAWSDIDLDTSDMKTIVQIPQILLGMMGTNPMATEIENPLMGKEYIIYDLGKMMELEGQDFDYEEMMKFQKEFQPKLIKFMEDIQKDLKLDSDIIQLKEEKDVDGEKIKVYEVSLNDESLREVVKDLVNYLLENDATKEFIVEYMNGYMATMKNMGMINQLSDEELEELEELEEDMADMDENIEKFKEEFNLFMEKYKDIKILGEEGINILYFINEDGYIAQEDGVMDFSIDLGDIAKLKETKDEDDDEDEDEMLYPAPEMKGKINFKINYSTKNMNINSKDIKVVMPELTPENSIDMQEMIEVQE